MSVELLFRIPMVSMILDYFTWTVNSKAQDSGFPNPDYRHMGPITGRLNRPSKVVFNVLPILVYTDLRGDLRRSL